MESKKEKNMTKKTTKKAVKPKKSTPQLVEGMTLDKMMIRVANTKPKGKPRTIEEIQNDPDIKALKKMGGFAGFMIGPSGVQRIV